MIGSHLSQLLLNGAQALKILLPNCGRRALCLAYTLDTVRQAFQEEFDFGESQFHRALFPSGERRVGGHIVTPPGAEASVLSENGAPTDRLGRGEDRGTWPHNALFGNWPTAADADWARDMKVTGCSHQPEIEGTCA
jgi:hypothetical protein